MVGPMKRHIRLPRVPCQTLSRRKYQLHVLAKPTAPAIASTVEEHNVILVSGLVFAQGI